MQGRSIRKPPRQVMETQPQALVPARGVGVDAGVEVEEGGSERCNRASLMTLTMYIVRQYQSKARERHIVELIADDTQAHLTEAKPPIASS